MASVLWIEVMRRAASLNSEAARRAASALRRKVVEIRTNATFHQVAEVEQAIQEAIFKIAKSSYIRLIFHVNHAFSIGRFPLAATRDKTAQHRDFVHAWREAKLLELRAIADGTWSLR